MPKRTFDIDGPTGKFHVEISEGNILMYGKLPKRPDDKMVTYAAAAPIDQRSSFTGSGMPFANYEQAFYATPNKGVSKVEKDGSFSIRLSTPASYYVGLGTVLVRPTIFLTYLQGGKTKMAQVPVDDPVAFRLSTYPMQFTKPRDSPAFYLLDADVLPRTQEGILRASAYPTDNVMPKNFWGTKPPV